MYLNHFAVHQKLTQHCKSTVLQFKKSYFQLAKYWMLSEHYTAAVVIATRFNVLALIIRWSTKEVTKRPFKIVCTFSCKLWRNELLLLLTLEVVITNYLWSVHLFLKLNFLDFILVFWREDTLGTCILVLSWIPDWQRRRGAPTHIILFSSIWYVLFLQAQASELHKRTFLRSVYLYQTYFGGKTIQNRHQTSQAKASWSEQFFFPSLHINFYYFINSC